MLNYFFSNDKYEKEKECAQTIINKLTKELECQTLPEHIRERKGLILKCVKYYYGM
jgi:recombination DNA repair RAD52 pathway protein